MTVLMIVMIVMVIMMLVMVMYIAPFGVCGRWEIFLIYCSTIIKTSLCILSIYSQLFRCIITSSITSISAPWSSPQELMSSRTQFSMSGLTYLCFSDVETRLGTKQRPIFSDCENTCKGWTLRALVAHPVWNTMKYIKKYTEMHQEIHWSAMIYIEMHWFTLKWPRNTSVHIARIVLWEILR